MSGFQRDYMPEMEEGSILYMPTTVPGLPSREAGWMLQQMDRKLKEFPEVARVFGKLGRADTSTDPAPMMMTEATMLLKPTTEWRPGLTKERLIAEMDGAMQLVGYVNAWTQPIAGRIAMQDTGIQTPVGIKVKGPDVAVIEEISAPDRGSCSARFRARASVIAERISQGFYVDVENDLARLAENGVTRGRSDVDRALRDRRRQRRDGAATGRHHRAVQHPICSGVYRYARKDPQRARIMAGGKQVPLRLDRRRRGAGDAGDDPQRRR